MDGHDGFGLASITAGDVIAAGARIEIDGDDHRHIKVFLPTGKAEVRVARAISNKAKLLIPPKL